MSISSGAGDAGDAGDVAGRRVFHVAGRRGKYNWL